MKYFFELNSNNDIYNIEFKKNIIKYDNSIFKKMSDVYKNFKDETLKVPDKKYLLENMLFIYKKGLNILLKNFGMDNITNIYIINTNSLDNSYTIENDSLNKFKKYKNLKIAYDESFYAKYFGKHSNNKYISGLDKEYIDQKVILITLYTIYDKLEIGGNMYFFNHTYYNYNTFNLIFLIQYFFDKIYVVNGSRLFCMGYKIRNIGQNDIKKIFYNNDFTIHYDKDIFNDFYKYLINICKNKIEIYSTKNENEFIKKMYKQYFDLLLEGGLADSISKLELDTYFIDKFKLISTGKKLDMKKINSFVKYNEGSYIMHMIKKYNYKKCLEIGMANGLSTLYILINNTKLISIDPYQKTQWKSEGINLIKKYNLQKNHKLIQKKSYEALPKLLEKEGDCSFDFIFIDGWHTFDYTLVDFFYSSLLLKVGGLIVIDDALHPGVQKCIKYLDSNYTFFQKMKCPLSLGSYKKIKNDDRPWDFNRYF